jgi:hypothetical protein
MSRTETWLLFLSLGFIAAGIVVLMYMGSRVLAALGDIVAELGIVAEAHQGQTGILGVLEDIRSVLEDIHADDKTPTAMLGALEDIRTAMESNEPGGKNT